MRSTPFLARHPRKSRSCSSIPPVPHFPIKSSCVLVSKLAIKTFSLLEVHSASRCKVLAALYKFAFRCPQISSHRSDTVFIMPPSIDKSFYDTLNSIAQTTGKENAVQQNK